ncbi:hypothetical protein NCS56_00823500 [Fusarium sp. Ph1]|nr:hypothetical protein NCS56_00823500 [Fusarium sp. Ph1]
MDFGRSQSSGDPSLKPSNFLADHHSSLLFFFLFITFESLSTLQRTLLTSKIDQNPDDLLKYVTALIWILFRLSFVANRKSVRQTCYTLPQSRMDSTASKC